MAHLNVDVSLFASNLLNGITVLPFFSLNAVPYQSIEIGKTWQLTTAFSFVSRANAQKTVATAQNQTYPHFQFVIRL